MMKRELPLKERVNRLSSLIAFAKENDFNKELIKNYSSQLTLLSEIVQREKAKRQEHRKSLRLIA